MALGGLDGGLKTLEANLKAQNDRITATAVKDGCASDLDSKDKTDAAAYVAEKCNATGEALVAALNAYKGEIAAAYSDLTAKIDFKPTKNAEALQKDIDAYAKVIDTAEQSVKDYSKVFGVKEGYIALLDQRGTDANDVLLGIEGIKRVNPDLYNLRRADVLKSISDAKSAAEIVFDKTNLANATANVKVNEEAYVAADTEIAKAEDQTDAWQKRNDSMNSLLNQYDAFDEEIQADKTALDAIGLDEDETKDYNKKLLAATNAVKALLDVATAGYVNLDADFSETEYDPQIKAAQDAVNDLTALKTTYTYRIAAYDQLTVLKNDIAKGQSGLQGDGVSATFLEDKFAENITSLEAAVKAVDSESSSNAVIESIKTVQGFVADLVDALSLAKKDLKAYEDDINWLNSNCTVTTTVDGKTFAGYATLQEKISGKDGKGGFKAQLSGWNKDYAEVTNVTNPQECYEQAVALGESIGKGWFTNVANAFNDYIKGLSQANLTCVRSAITEIESLVDDIDKNESFAKAKTDFGSIDKDLTAAVDMPTTDDAEMNAKLEACNKANSALQTLWNSPISGMNENCVLYQQFVDDIDTQLGNPYAELKEFIDGYKSDAAYKYYTGLLENLQKDFDAQKTKLKASLNKLNVVNEKATFSSAIESLTKRNGKGGTVYNTVSENEGYHLAQLETSKATKSLLINLLAEVQSYEGSVEYAQKWIEPLTSLRESDLKTANNAVEEAYAAGKSVAQDADLLAMFKVISDKANAIVEQFRNDNDPDGWYQTVKKNNDAYVAAGSAWSELEAEMEGTYVKAINAYNAYVGLNNGYVASDGFKAAVSENSAELFNLQAKYRAIVEEVSNYISLETAKMHAITPEEFQTEAIAKADAVIAQMISDANGLIAKFDQAGMDYYTLREGQVKAKYDANKAMLEGDPYNYSSADAAKILVVYKEYWDEANDLYDETPKTSDIDDYKDGIGYVMGEIANILDKAYAMNLNAQVIAKVWNPKYQSVKAQLDQLAKDIEEYGKGATESVYNEEKKNFENNVKAAAALNDGITGIADLLAVSGGVSQINRQIALLDDYLDAADTAVGKVKDSQELNQMDSDFNTAAADSQNQLSALQQMPDKLGGVAKYGLDTESVKTAVNAFLDKLNDYKAKKASQAEVIEKKDAASAAIASALSVAVQAEKEYLNSTDPAVPSYLDILKVAYNDARAKDPDNLLDAENAEILGYQAAIQGLPGKYNTPKTFLAYANDLETGMASLIAKLQGLAQTSPTTESQKVNGLNGTYNNVAGKINTGLAAVAQIKVEYAQPELKAEYDALMESLNAIKAAYEAAGTNVITQSPVYINQMTVVEGKIASIDQKVQVATAQADYYVKLSTEQAGYQKQYDDLRDYIYNPEHMTDPQGMALGSMSVLWDDSYVDYYNVLYNISYELQQNTQSVNYWYEEGMLDSESNLPNNFGEGQDLTLVTLEAHKSYTLLVASVANADVQKIFSVLGSGLVPELQEDSWEIYSQASGLSSRVWDVNRQLNEFGAYEYIQENKYDAGVALLDSLLDQLKQISEEAAKLLDDADALTYLPGDIDDDGEIDIADAQMMNKLILDGVTFEDLVNDKQARKAYAADIIGNGKINIADYTALINMILNRETNNGPRRISRASLFGVMSSKVSEGYINIVPVADENGIRTYAVEISDPEAFVAGQIDFLVESTSRIVGVRGAERLFNHDVQSAKLGGATRVVITSEDNSLFEGNTAVTLYIDVEGRSGLGFKDAVFADSNAQAYTFEDKAIGTTGIDSLYEGAKAVKEAVYDAAGRVMKSVQRGINIIRNSNGTVTKEIHR